MSNWNGKVRCVSAFGRYLIKGKIYEVHNGFFTTENGEQWGDFNDINELNRKAPSQFEEIAIPQPHKSLLKSGMKVVYRDGSERYVFLPAGVFMDKNGKIRNSLSSYSDDILINNPFNSPNSQDVIEIYSEDCELIAKREEKSAKDMKIDDLEKRMRELADEIAELKGE